MYIVITNIVITLLLLYAINKANHHKNEWIILILFINSVAMLTSYLFGGNSTYTFITLGSTQIHSGDICFIFLLAYCIIVMLKPIRRSKLLASLLLLYIPLGITLVRGIMAGTLGTANFLADIRKYFAFIIILTSFYFVFRKKHTDYAFLKVKIYINRFANCVIAFMFIIWLLDLVFGLRSLPGQIVGTLSDGGSTFRIVTPSIVIVLAFYTLTCINDDIRLCGSIRSRSIVLILSVILLQWRTVVAAFLVGLLLLMLDLFFVEKLLSKKTLAQIVSILLVGTCFVLFFASDESMVYKMISNLFDSYSSISSGTGTFSTRTEVWTMLLDSLSGVNTIFGQPFGTGYASSVTWVHSAHSGYVDYIMKMGYVGLAALLLFMLNIILVGIRKNKHIISILMTSLLVYWIGYGLGYEIGAVIGICLGELDCDYKRNIDIPRG